MVNGNRGVGLVFTLTFVSVLLATSGNFQAYAGDSPGGQEKLERLEKIARQMLRDIYSGSLHELEKLIRARGTMSTDFWVPRAEVVKDLNDKNSHVYKSLREELGEPQLKFCKKDGDTLASPYAFYKAYGEKYKIEIEKRRITYMVIFLAGDALVGGEAKIKCRLILNYATFREIRGEFFIDSFLYSF